MKVTASVTVRLRGRFPKASYARVLLPARERVRADVERAFDQKKDPQTGRPWQPRVVQAGRRPPAHPLLDKTGTLKAGALAAAATASVSGHTLRVRQTEPPWAAFHAKGTRTMVARRSVGVSASTRKWVARRLAGEGVRVFRGRRR